MKSDQFQNKEDAMMKELLVKLMTVAFENKHRKFEFIRNWQMRQIAKAQKKGLQKVIRYFNALKTDTEIIFQVELLNKRPDMSTVGMYIEVEHCLEFYKKELKILNDMLAEHREYMFSFHLLDTFILNRWRPDVECYDHRKIFRKGKK